MTETGNSESDTLHSAQDDLAPPWEVFPIYERHSLGWRMGTGEDYKCDWWNFIESLPSDFESRLKYLKRNRPAPINWYWSVLEVLYPEQDNDKEYEDSDREIKELLELLKFLIYPTLGKIFNII